MKTEKRFELIDIDVNRDQELKSAIIDAVTRHAEHSDKVVTSFSIKWAKDGNGIYIDKFIVNYRGNTKTIKYVQ